MASDLRLLPRRQLGVGISQHFGRFGLQLLDFSFDIERTFIGRVLQLQNPGFESRDRFFKIKIGCHEKELEPDRRNVNARDFVGSTDDDY